MNTEKWISVKDAVPDTYNYGCFVVCFELEHRVDIVLSSPVLAKWRPLVTVYQHGKWIPNAMAFVDDDGTPLLVDYWYQIPPHHLEGST